MIYGSGQLCNTLLKEGLIDEHRLWIVPVIWGRGKRLFEGMDTTSLELLEARTLPSGTVILTHGPAQG